MKYVQYIRVSTSKQGQSGLGLESQKDILNYYIGEHTEKIFLEIESGKNRDRQELKKAIEYCLRNNCGLAFAKVDRLSRNTEYALNIFSQLGGNLFSCDVPQQVGSKMDKFTLTIMLAIADREGELISIRTKSAMKKKVQRDGEWRKGSEIFKDGTASKMAGKAKKIISKNRENNKKVFETILMYREKGLNWSEIAKKLNFSGFGTALNNHTIKNKVKLTKGFQSNQVKRIFDKYATQKQIKETTPKNLQAKLYRKILRLRKDGLSWSAIAKNLTTEEKTYQSIQVQRIYKKYFVGKK